MKHAWWTLCATAVAVALMSGCSPSKFAVEITIDALTATGSSEVFSGDADPVLVGDALPFALKMYESLLTASPDHEELLSVTGSGYVSYANAYCHLPASMEESYKERERLMDRAALLYLRGRDYALRAVEVRNPGFLESLERKDFEKALDSLGQEDAEDLYWAAAGWFGAIAARGFDMRSMLEVSTAYALLAETLRLDEGFANGAVHELLLSVLPSAPPELRYRAAVDPSEDRVREAEKEYFRTRGIDTVPAGSAEAALHHYERAVELSGGGLAGPFVACAESLAIPRQDYPWFRELLERAVSVDLEQLPSARLVNTLQKEKARWLIDHADDYFLITEEENDDDE